MALTDDQERRLDTLADGLMSALTKALEGPQDPEAIRISLCALAFCAALILAKTRDPEFYAFFHQTLNGYVDRYLAHDAPSPSSTIQ